MPVHPTLDAAKKSLLSMRPACSARAKMRRLPPRSLMEIRPTAAFDFCAQIQFRKPGPAQICKKNCEIWRGCLAQQIEK
jgi:hypothetical protein